MSDSSRWLTPVVFWVGLLIAALVLWLSGQAGAAVETLRGARIWPMVGVLGLGMSLPVIHAWRWQQVIAALGSRLPLHTAAGLTVSASLVNYATPGFLGAPAKAILANRSDGVPIRKSLVSIVLEQGLDFLLLVVGSGLVILLLGPSRFDELLSLGGWLPSPYLGLAIAAAGAVIVLLSGRSRIANIRRKIAEAVHEVREEVRWPAVWVLTFAYWAVQVLVIWVLLWALRLPADPLSVLALGTLPLLAGQLAPVPGGVGVREATMVALTGVSGIPTADLLGLAILQRVLLVVALPLSLLALRVIRGQVSG